MKKYLGELLWTFFFVLSIGLAVKFGGAMTGLAIWTALAVLVYAWGHISWAHFNPAVTLWLATSGKLSRSEVLPYWISQILWAILAGLLVTRIIGSPIAAAALDPNTTKILVVELLYTFALVWVVHNVAATKCNEWNSFYGLAIGLIVFVWATSVWSISWGWFNPAVVIWSTFDGIFTRAWIRPHLVGQLIGAILAWLAYRSLCCDSDSK